MFSTLIMDPFASHVVRSLMVLLCPHLFHSDSPHKAESRVRSKRSVAWKAKQGPMKSVFHDDKSKGKAASVKTTLKEFKDAARTFVVALKADLGANEVRSLAANKVASPVLQVKFFSSSFGHLYVVPLMILRCY